MTTVRDRLQQLHDADLLPLAHQQYLTRLQQSGINPSVIYDVGACVMHWHSHASMIWPQAKFCLVDALAAAKFLYQHKGVDYHIGVLSSSSRRTVTFFNDELNPGGNSYYPENPQLNPCSVSHFSKEKAVVMPTLTLDQVMFDKGWPAPQLIKMDVQGAEHDILQGMTHCLKTVQHLILELQHVEYNQGAPLSHEVSSWLGQRGFEQVGDCFCNNGPDGDYHFARKRS
jgi:FkbM family methyltransferase